MSYFPGIMLGLVFAFSIINICLYFRYKKKINKIGKIKCDRCGYQGKAAWRGNIYNSKIVCSDCNSEAWKKIS